jgi:hypothetical protein
MVRDGVANLVSRLRERECDPRKVGHDAWVSRCPAHRSLDRALSVTRNEFNHVALRCRSAENCDHTQRHPRSWPEQRPSLCGDPRVVDQSVATDSRRAGRTCGNRDHLVLQRSPGSPVTRNARKTRGFRERRSQCKIYKGTSPTHAVGRITTSH